jgi:hypothetical protein
MFASGGSFFARLNLRRPGLQAAAVGPRARSYHWARCSTVSAQSTRQPIPSRPHAATLGRRITPSHSWRQTRGRYGSLERADECYDHPSALGPPAR